MDIFTGNPLQVGEAEFIFGQMLKETDYRPDGKMFEALVRGYLLQNDYDAALGIFDNILDMSIRGSGAKSTSDSGGSQASGLRQRLEAFKDEFPDHSEVVDAFLELDDDDDGFIATVEIRALLRRLGLNPTVDELTAMTRVVLDVNNSGKVNYFDFL